MLTSSQLASGRRYESSNRYCSDVVGVRRVWTGSDAWLGGTAYGGDLVATLTLDDGSAMTLGAVLAKAGEGTIYQVHGRKDLVAKIFHPALKDLSLKLEKVAAMIADPPAGAMQADGFVVLTWPQQLLSDADRPVGYVMPRIDTAMAVEIHSVSNPYNRVHPLRGAPQWPKAATWSHLVSVAANLCLAVDVVHRVNAVIGDFQERNILVADTTRVTLVDCDSMQIIDGSGRQFLCEVGRPEFTAPELSGIDLRVQPRQKQTDLFALAVHIYQLLMAGNHPFMRGVWTGSGEQPAALSLAKTGFFAGGPGSPLASHPLAPPLSFLPADVGGLFIRAFTDGAEHPHLRPTADQWRRTLSQMRTTDCGPGGHQIPVGTDDCPWCRIDAERGRRKRSVPVRYRAAPPAWSDDLLNAPVRWPTNLAPPGPRTVTAPTVWSGGRLPAGQPVSGHHPTPAPVMWPAGFNGPGLPPSMLPNTLLHMPRRRNVRVVALATFLTVVAVLVVIGLSMIVAALVEINASTDTDPPVITTMNSPQFARSAAAVRREPARRGFAAEWPGRARPSFAAVESV